MEKAEFGAFVARSRKDLGLTQKELAEKLHVTDKAVSKWERGLSYPDVTLLEPLAAVFGLGVTELVSCRKKEDAPPPAAWTDREIPPPKTETSPEAPAVLTLLDISGESLRTERKRKRRLTALLAALAILLLAALAVAVLLLGKSRTTESNQIKVLHTEGTDADLVLFIEKEGHLLRLTCAPALDPSALLELVSFGDPFLAEYRWDRRSWRGTLLSYRRVETGMAIGGPMDEVGSVFVLYNDDGNLFGFSNVVERILSRQPNPNGAGYLSTYVFYRRDSDGSWEKGAFFAAKDCLGFSTYGDQGYRIIDTDGDGANEFLLRTVWPEKPCIVYDLEDGVITETWLDQLPEEMTGPAS